MDIPGRHGVIKMKLPGPIGIQMRAAKPTDPLRVIVDLSPVRHLAIELQFELPPLLNNRGIWGWEPGHSALKLVAFPQPFRTFGKAVNHQPFGAFPFGIGGLLIRPSLTAACISADSF